uniref:Putative transporter MCH1 n=1 Tax=Anthurium amnicola TaxID=1678845 RepID=A0A1D1Z3U2_9ARAE
MRIPGRRSKWSATAASIWIQCTSGSLYCFGIYSPLLKSSQGYTQSTLNSIALFKDVGGNAGLTSGILYSSSLCGGGGPRPVLAVGAALSFAGFFPLWLAVTGAVPPPPVPLMCLFMFVASIATTFFNTANVVTAAHNFPDNRGTVVGIMKGFLGLSGAILIQLYRTTFEGKPSYFLLMLAVLPTCLTLLLLSFVNVHHSFHRDERPLLNGFSFISLIVAGYLMLIIIWESIQPQKLLTRVLIFTLLLLLLISPISIVMKGHSKDSPRQLERSIHERTPLLDGEDQSVSREQIEHEIGRIVYDKMPNKVFPSTSTHGNTMLPREDNYTLLQAMRTINFWLMFLAMACGMGSGLATVNNIGQIGHSLGYTSTETNTLVSLWSIWNFLGRFGAGYISDYFLLSKGCARPLFIAITLAIMSIGHVVISSGMPAALYVGSIFVGLCYGCQWSLAPIITSEIFGLKHMGTIFNMICIASPIGSYILSVKVVGYIYDKKVGTLSDLRACTGDHCFMLSFLIMGSVSLFGCIVASLLFFRTRKLYELVIFPRLQLLQ